MHLLSNDIILAIADTALVVPAAVVPVVEFDVLVHGVGALRRGEFGGAQHRWCGMGTQGNDKASGGHLGGDFLSDVSSHDYGWSYNHTDCT